MADRSRRKRGVERKPSARSGAAQVVPGGVAQEARLRWRRTEAQPGKAGRPRLIDRDASLLEDLEGLLEPHSLDQPPLVWTCHSTRDLADELAARGHQISQRSLVALLHHLGFDLRGKHKRHEEQAAAAANAQLERILGSVLEFRRRRQPMVFVEVKPLRRRQPSPAFRARLEVEIARHATETLKQWWQRRGRSAFPRARSLLVVTSYRGPAAALPVLWLDSLAELAGSFGLELQVRHFPAATTRWTDLSGGMTREVAYQGRPALDVAVHTIAATPQRLRLARAAQGGNGHGKNGKMLKAIQLPAAWNYTVAATTD